MVPTIKQSASTSSSQKNKKSFSIPSPALIPPVRWDPPHSLEAERGVLGCMMESPREAADEALVKLAEEYFYDPRNAIIFSSIKHLLENNHPLDTITLTQYLSDQKLLDQIGGYPYIAQIIAEVPSPMNIYSYTNIVKNKYLMRQTMHSCAEVLHSINESPDDPAPVLDQAQAAFYRISEDHQNPEIQSAGELVMPVMKLIDEMALNRGKITGVSTGFIDMDRLTSGLQKGDMIVFAARPGVGKTSFALNIAEHAALETKKSVAIFSLEMSCEQLMLRLVASRARVDLKSLRSGFIENHHQKITDALNEMRESRLFFDETAGITLQQLRTKARRLKRRHDIDLLIVDYLQLIQSGNQRKNDSRQADVAEISGGIKAIARELKIPVVILCQLNREPEKRGGGQPRLSDLRESGAIEQDADIVGLLYRPELYKEDDKMNEEGDLEGIAYLDIQKHRNGPTGRIELTFLKHLTRFESAARKTDLSH